MSIRNIEIAEKVSFGWNKFRMTLLVSRSQKEFKE